MSETILEQYDERYKLSPLTPDHVLVCVEAAEQILLSDVRPADLVDERVICWLADRLQAIYAVLENPGIPVASRCAWCFCAGPQTDETWNALPKMTMDDAAAHSQVCDHNPMVRKIRDLERRVEELQAHAARTIEHFDRERGRL